MAIDGVQITRLPNGKYLVKDEFSPDGFEATQEEITNAYGISAEQINIFVAEQEASNAPDEPVINGGKPNSVFTAKAKANTGLANANDKIQTEDDYARMEKEYAEALKTRVGYGDADAAAHAKGMVQTQKAADRVEASVYFTPNQKEEYEKQKKELEAQGKRPVLLTEEDMQLLKPPAFVLRDKRNSVPVDINGNVIDENDPDAANKYVTAFNEDGTLNQDMVKLISAQRVGSDNELELEERAAETSQLKEIAEDKVTRDDAKPVADLYERLGYDVQKDDEINAKADEAVKKKRRKGAGLGALIGGAIGTLLGEIFHALSKTKTQEFDHYDVTPEEVHTLPDTTVPGGAYEVTTDVTVSVTYVTPGEHHEHDDVGPGGTVHYEWNDPDVTTTVTTVVSTTQTITDPDVVVPGGTYTTQEQKVPVYEEKEKYTISRPLSDGVLGTVGAIAGGLIGAQVGKNKGEKEADAMKAEAKDNDILGEKDHDDVVTNMYYTGNYSSIKGERNQQMMKYVVDKAKEKNMSKDEFMQFMKYAQGSNECLTEKELLNMFNLIDDYKVPPKKEPDPVKPEPEQEDPLNGKWHTIDHESGGNYTLNTKGVGIAQYVSVVYNVRIGTREHKEIMKAVWEANPGLRNSVLKLGTRVTFPEVGDYKPNLEIQPGEKQIGTQTGKIYTGTETKKWQKYGAGEHRIEGEKEYDTPKEAEEADLERQKAEREAAKKKAEEEKKKAEGGQSQ